MGRKEDATFLSAWICMDASCTMHGVGCATVRALRKLK